MGCASNDSIEIIIRNNKEKIEAAKNEINNLREKHPNDCFSIIFKLMDGKCFCIPCFNQTKLYDIFLMLIDKAKDSYYSKLDKLKMYYNSVDITNNFHLENGKTVSSLKLNSFNPIIHINV